jgi:hypothetical protein
MGDREYEREQLLDLMKELQHEVSESHRTKNPLWLRDTYASRRLSGYPSAKSATSSPILDSRPDSRERCESSRSNNRALSMPGLRRGSSVGEIPDSQPTIRRLYFHSSKNAIERNRRRACGFQLFSPCQTNFPAPNLRRLIHPNRHIGTCSART